MGKKKSRSKHKNSNKSQNSSSEDVQEPNSDMKEEHNQSCDYDMLKEECISCPSALNGVHSESCNESHEDSSDLGKSSHEIISRCDRFTSNKMKDKGVPLQPNTTVVTEPLNENQLPVNGQLPILNTLESVSDKIDHEPMHQVVNERTHATETPGSPNEPLKDNAGKLLREQEKVNGLTMVSEMENNHGTGDHLLSIHESRAVTNKTDSLQQSLSPALVELILNSPLTSEVESKNGSKNQSEKAKVVCSSESPSVHTPSSNIKQVVSDFPPTTMEGHHQVCVSNDLSSNLSMSDNECSLATEEEICRRTQPDESDDISQNNQEPQSVNSSVVDVTVAGEDKKCEVGSLLEELKSNTASIEQMPICQISSISNEAVDLMRVRDKNNVQQAQNKGNVVFVESQENTSEIATTEFPKIEDNAGLSSNELPGKEKIACQKDSTSVNHGETNKSGPLVAVRGSENAESIPRLITNNSQVQGQEKEDHNDLVTPENSSIDAENVDLQAHTKSKSKTQQDTDKTELTVAISSKLDSEVIDVLSIHTDKPENQNKDNNTESIAAMSINIKTELTAKAEDVAGTATPMNTSVQNQEDKCIITSNKKNGNQKRKNNKQKTMKGASRTETKDGGPDSSFTNADLLDSRAEGKKEGGVTAVQLEASKKHVIKREEQVISNDMDSLMPTPISDPSENFDLSSKVGDANEETHTECNHGMSSMEMGAEKESKTHSNTRNKIPPKTPSPKIGAKRKQDEKKRQVTSDKPGGKPSTEDREVTLVTEGEKAPVTVDKINAEGTKKPSRSAGVTVDGSTKLFIDDNDQTFQARPIFMANTCHVCKSTHGGETRLKSCSACRLIAYCSKEHQRIHWKEHKHLCQQVQKRIKRSGLQDLYGDAHKVTDAEEWRKYRCFQIVDIEKHMGRPLMPFEREMLLYPRVCSVCHKSDPEKLKVCKGCHYINYCTSEHLPISHKIWCKDLKLLLQLNQYQSRYGLIRPHIPNINLDGRKPFPKSMKDFFSVSLLNERHSSHFNLYEGVLSDVATCPLTICHTLNLLNGVNQTDVCQKLTIHLVGAENQFEVEPLSKWDSFLLNLLPHVNKLHLVFIGPELEPTNIEEVSDNGYQTIEIKTVNISKKLTAEFYYGQLYHDYTNSSSYIKPDLISAFNCGIYRFTGYNNKDTWGPTITSMVKDTNIPILLTAYTEFEAPKDVARFKKQCNAKELISPMKNPFASMRPNLNFVSDDETPLIYKNQYLSVVKGCD